MIWKAVAVLGALGAALAHEPAVSEQHVTRHVGHHGELAHIGERRPEHHEEYAWSYPSYEFSYHVNDPHTGDNKGQQESRQGDEVKGEYWLIEPDGRKRTVKYHADGKSGFHADVHYSGPHHHVHHNTHHAPSPVHHEPVHVTTPVPVHVSSIAPVHLSSLAPVHHEPIVHKVHIEHHVPHHVPVHHEPHHVPHHVPVHHEPVWRHHEPIVHHEPIMRHEPVMHHEPMRHHEPVMHHEPIVHHEPIMHHEPMRHHVPMHHGHAPLHHAPIAVYPHLRHHREAKEKKQE